jgi:ABC-2 type transport system permease protein
VAALGHPVGWAELLRPLTGPQPLVLLLPAVTTALLLALAAGLARRRDVGAGLFPRHDSADPRLWLLTSPTAQALRGQAAVVTAWLAGTAAFLMILGVVSHSLSTADVPANVQRQIAKLGSGSIVTPTGYIAFLFLFVALAICLFVCTQISALRRDEEQHLESVLAQPVSRSSWLAGRLILAAFAAAAIALAAGIAAWVGATAAGVHGPCQACSKPASMLSRSPYCFSAWAGWFTPWSLASPPASCTAWSRPPSCGSSSAP